MPGVQKGRARATSNNRRMNQDLGGRDALGAAWKILDESHERLSLTAWLRTWRSDGRRLAFVITTVVVFLVAVVLDAIGGEKKDMADHLIDLAKFVLPIALASNAVIRYGESRLLCCVLQRDSREGEAQR